MSSEKSCQRSKTTILTSRADTDVERRIDGCTHRESIDPSTKDSAKGNVNVKELTRFFEGKQGKFEGVERVYAHKMNPEVRELPPLTISSDQLPVQAVDSQLSEECIPIFIKEKSNTLRKNTPKSSLKILSKLPCTEATDSCTNDSGILEAGELTTKTADGARKTFENLQNSINEMKNSSIKDLQDKVDTAALVIEKLLASLSTIEPWQKKMEQDSEFLLKILSSIEAANPSFVSYARTGSALNFISDIFSQNKESEVHLPMGSFDELQYILTFFMEKISKLRIMMSEKNEKKEQLKRIQPILKDMKEQRKERGIAKISDRMQRFTDREVELSANIDELEVEIVFLLKEFHHDSSIASDLTLDDFIENLNGISNILNNIGTTLYLSQSTTPFANKKTNWTSQHSMLEDVSNDLRGVIQTKFRKMIVEIRSVKEKLKGFHSLEEPRQHYEEKVHKVMKSVSGILQSINQKRRQLRTYSLWWPENAFTEAFLLSLSQVKVFLTSCVVVKGNSSKMHNMMNSLNQDLMEIIQRKAHDLLKSLIHSYQEIMQIFEQSHLTTPLPTDSLVGSSSTIFQPF